jgi:SpoVK/Ycf46/Vps4 family AAA+-type ATPase
MPGGVGDAFVIPISRNAMAEGNEWTEMVAMVPMAAMPDWAALTSAGAIATRTLDAARLVMRVYNGPDIRISPMALDDLVLEPDVKSAFADDILGFLTRRDWYAERNLPWTRKYLLNGPPGTGKTSLARWAASALGMPCMGFDFTDRYADGRTLNSCLSQAGSMSPCLVVLDDIDKVLSGGNNTQITTQSLQTALSGMGNLDGVIVIATANSTTAIKGVLSDGSENPLARRFDQIITVPLPTAQLRVEYASRLLSKDGIGAVDLMGMVGGASTDNWSYDDVRAAVTAAASQAVKRGADSITIDDMKRGVATVYQRKLEAPPSASMKTRSGGG